MQGVFVERTICSRKRDVETSRREEEIGRVKGSGEGLGREKRKRRIFFLPSPSPLSFFRPSSYRKGYYFYSPQSSTVIKSKMAATTILRTRTRFRPPKIRLHCRLIQLMIDRIGSDFDNIFHSGNVISPGNEDKRQK